jgi:AcrR family transcriptional regulator
VTAVTTTPRRRPRDRKDQIVQTARKLIAARGYHNVSMADIADSVGITAGALYRHFSNKSVLLGAVIEKALDEWTAPAAQPEATLQDVVKATCELLVGNRDMGALWWRESRNLDPETFDRLRGRLIDNSNAYRRLIQAERPELSKADAQRLAWGVQAVLSSPSFHSSELPRAQFVGLLSTACVAVCAVDASTSLPVPRIVGRLEPASKRERLLTHAVTLFERNGFEATSLSDIGAAAGVTGPSLYSYFDSKADILEIAMVRGDRALWLLLNRVLRNNTESSTALRDLIRGYSQLSLEEAVPTSVLLTEQHNLGDEVGDEVRAGQREYVAEWVALLRSARPELNEKKARVLVHTALAVVNIMTEVSHAQDHPEHPDDVAAMASAVLFVA